MADMQLVVFQLEGQQYGIDMNCVYGINRMRDFKIIKIPNAPAFVDGVINLRNSIIPMYNLRKKFHINEDYYNQNSEILIVNTGKTSVGFTVDEVLDIIKLSGQDIAEAPDILTGIDNKFISSIGKTGEAMIIILDANKILSEKEQEQVTQYMSEEAV